MPARVTRLGSPLLLILVIFLTGCQSVPLGDPEKAVTNDKLNGWWMPEKPGALVYISAYDSRTHYITYYSYEGDPAAPKLQDRTSCKAWMTSVGGMDVLCCKIIDPEWDLHLSKEGYSYYRIRKAPGLDPSSMEVTTLNLEFLRDVKTPDELAKKIADNANNTDLFKGSEPVVWHFATGKKMEEVEKLLKAFAPPKQIPFEQLDHAH